MNDNTVKKSSHKETTRKELQLVLLCYFYKQLDKMVKNNRKMLFCILKKKFMADNSVKNSS